MAVASSSSDVAFIALVVLPEADEITRDWKTARSNTLFSVINLEVLRAAKSEEEEDDDEEENDSVVDAEVYCCYNTDS